ncbi:MAG: glutathione S-transferase [Alphaproteobacteria bacterium]
MKLYDAAVSGNCHKVRMFLSMLTLDHEVVPVSLPDMEQKTPEHMARNPIGSVPVLEDGAVTIYDSQAILVYLASRQVGEAWLPEDPVGRAKVQQWLSFAVNELWNGPALARANLLFGRDIDLARAQAAAHVSLAVMDRHLKENDWLALDRPTIADLACYPYSALAGEGEISLAPFAALAAWFERIKALEGYVSMAGLD